VEEIPEISEIDLNPIFALPLGQGCRIVDARIRVSAEASSLAGLSFQQSNLIKRERTRWPHGDVLSFSSRTSQKKAPDSKPTATPQKSTHPQW